MNKNMLDYLTSLKKVCLSSCLYRLSQLQTLHISISSNNAHFGYSIGRTTYDQVNEGTAVSISNLVAGDLILFYDGPSHVGMYIGNDQFVHAANEQLGVRVDTLSGYYAGQVHSCRRIIN